MAQTAHSFGPTCAFHHFDTPPVSAGDQPLPVQAQFFYISLLPIDDPLSPVPSISSDKAKNALPQPFSIRDNARLEEVWQRTQKDKWRNSGHARPPSRGLTRMTSFPVFQSGLKSPSSTSPTAESSSQGMFSSTSDKKRSVTSLNLQPAREYPSSEQARKPPSPKITRRSSLRSNSSMSKKQWQILTETQTITAHSTEIKDNTQSPDIREIRPSEHEKVAQPRKTTSPLRQRRRPGRQSPDSYLDTDGSPPARANGPEKSNLSLQAVDSDISGRPFARAPSSRQLPSVRAADVMELDSPTQTSPKSKLTNNMSVQTKGDGVESYVPVGLSGLHLVELPQMKMKPIYWNPINDISDVLRATWFYRDTMLPVPADVANQLEIGYEDMKPYAETYQDELNACVEFGAAAELKVVHTLWPEKYKENSATTTTRTDDKANDEEFDTETEEAISAPQNQLNAAVDPRRLKMNKKAFESHSVIYVNAREAQMLRPNALPSVSKNRTPLNSIRKGRQLGIAVVRGFDRKVWNKLHPDPKKDKEAVQARLGATMAQSGNETVRDQLPSCPKCEEDAVKPKVSDLVLVIHGIGQKLSERVDSYHFTHAINGLRREFNVELANASVRGSLKDNAGMMVLPVNWRLTVQFEEGQEAPENKYELTDITPDSLPAVRSLITDVMLDIPYYMSHHKSKMTAAVIREANRVYRLWCRNNPGFENYGRVHLVAHSLGSVMAMEILSNQPTFIPEGLDLTSDTPGEQIFEFNTANLFCCGSPSGFFLLLNGANLIPRRGRTKPGMEGEDGVRGIAGEQGTYGCLAVNNIYNICHRNDPIAYCQNACVDKTYAASLQPAPVPSVAQSLLYKIGSSLRWASSSAHDAYGFVPTTSRPAISHMPSTVELETHNFTREEIAEKRMFLLNDNGQIDYFLSSGGGALEIQYLNMLSAHSSYWVLPDFVRFLVVEIGRRPGRDETLPALRATKRRQYKKGSIA